jgi:hypothetical protein
MTVLDSVDRTFYTPIVALPVETNDQKGARAVDWDEAMRAQIEEYYQTWVGVRAPELGHAARDRNDKPVALASFRGKRVLLFSFLAFYDHPLTERELLDAVALTDWDKSVRPIPVEDHWSGKGPPQPTHTATLVWSRVLPRVVGMTGGDWDLGGSDDLILAAPGELLVFDLAHGTQRHRFPNEGIHAGLIYTLGWARVDKENSAVLVMGWSCSVTGRKCSWSTRKVKTWQRSPPTVTTSSKWRPRKWLAREKGKSCLFGRRTLGHWTTWSRRTSKATSSGNTP